METPEHIYQHKAYFNKWLNELTRSEMELIIEMMKEYAEVYHEANKETDEDE